MKNKLNIISVVPPNTTVVAKADSGASQNYWRPEDCQCLTHIQSYSGPSVTLPDADQLAPSEQGLISLSNKLSVTARRATVLPALKSASLISLGQICNDQCTVVINSNRLYAVKNRDVNIKVQETDILLRGTQNPKVGL